jgi:hypothetical protein
MPGATGQFMHVPRRHLLARAGLTENEYVGVKRRHLLDEAMHVPHRARCAARAKTVGAGLRRMPVPNAACLVQDRGETSLFHREIQVKPREITAGLRKLRQTVAAQVDQGQGYLHAA